MPPEVNSSTSVESQGIFQHGKDKDAEDQGRAGLPAHVNTVKDGLLDFNHFLGLEATMLVLGDEKSYGGNKDVIPLSAYKTDGLKASQRARERELVENAQDLAKGARKLKSGFAQDSEWRALFRKVATNRKDDAHYCGSHQPTTIACAENEFWDTDLDPGRSSCTNPKPDLYFGFPIHNAEDHRLAGFRNDPSLQNFTVNTLFQLAMKGLRSIPVSSSSTNVAEMKRDSTELQCPLLCFPWCIIQLKGIKEAAAIEETDDSVSETSREASVAATGALAMLETLSRFADVKQDGQHIPPVITITSIGPNTTVWLAYSDIIDDRHRDHKMLSIWNGCISEIWGAVQFCRIIDNLFFWSEHILRPKVSHYIDQWRLRYSPEVQNLHSRLEKDLETAELVHRIQDRLSSLNLSPNSSLPELIQQAVILQEVMGPNLRNTEPVPKNGQDPNAHDEIESSKKDASHLKVNASAVGASGDGVTEGGGQEGGESKGKEDDKEEDDKKNDDKMDDEKKGNDKKEEDKKKDESGDNGIYYSAGSLEEPTVQPKPPKKNVPVLDAAILVNPAASFEKSASGDSTATENEPDRRSTNTKPSTATDIILSTILRKRPPTSERVSKSEPPADSNAHEKRDKERSFLYPYRFKTSGLDSGYKQFVSHSLTLKREGLNNNSGSIDTPSAPPNPFIAKSFELSFYVRPWWGVMPWEKKYPQAGREAGPHYKPATQLTLSAGVDKANDADDYDAHGRIVRSDAPKRTRAEWQLVENLKPPFSRVKVPWTDGRFITVRLPPVMPVSRLETILVHLSQDDIRE